MAQALSSKQTRNPNNDITTYSANELLALRPKAGHIARTVRKCLFSLHLWNPKSSRASVTSPSCPAVSRLGPAPAINRHQVLPATRIQYEPIYDTDKQQRIQTVIGVFDRPPLRAVTNQRIQCLTRIPRLSSYCLNSREDNYLGRNSANLIKVPLVPQILEPNVSCEYPSTQITVGLLNTRSLRNKIDDIKDLVSEHSLDVFAFTETWLRSEDNAIITSLVSNDFSFHHVPRSQGVTGGGVGILVRKSLKPVIAATPQYKSFEVIECALHSCGKFIRLVIVYRPPASTRNRLQWSTFVAEYSDFVSHYTFSSGNLIILGDFNVNFRDQNDPKVLDYREILEVNNLDQLVNEQTHVHGRTLDHVIIRKSDDLVDRSTLTVGAPGITSDHSLITFHITATKPVAERKIISYKPWKKLDLIHVRPRLRSIIEKLIVDNDVPLSAVVQMFNVQMTCLLNEVLPLKTKVVSAKPAPPWYSHEVFCARAKRRKLEKLWRQTRLTVHLEMYQAQCASFKRILRQSKAKYYHDTIDQCSNDQKKLFQVVNNLLGRREASPLPSTADPSVLAEQFAQFFDSKIARIRSSIISVGPPSAATPVSTVTLDQPLTNFSSASVSEVRAIISTAPSKQCSLDVLPTWLIKDLLPLFVPFITSIINRSLAESTVPDVFKEAVVTPILKKPSLCPEDFASYRPISNLNFISKVVEKVVASRIIEHLGCNNLLEPLQSGYRRYHSTETALAKVYNDLSVALDQGKACLLVLLDLSSAFDTIDHSLLLERCESLFGIKGNALSWIRCYLSNRSQRVKIHQSTSEPKNLCCGVPQGSILGPLLFIMYTTPLGRILREENTDFHLYADDTQLYLKFEPSALKSASRHLEGTISKVSSWMSHNMLKLNTNKTEALVISSPQHLDTFQNASLQVGSDVVRLTSSARNVGVTFDSTLSMIPHINASASSANYHLRNLGRARKYLTKGATEQLVHSLVTSRLDYCNSLLVNVPKRHLLKLQNVQNTAARVITLTKRHEHITPVLQSLHWLPVSARIDYKLCLMTFKALHQMTPDYVTDMLKPYVPPRPLRSARQNLLVVPWTRTKTYGPKAFSEAAPRLWNSLPEELRLCPTVSSFKCCLKTYLFKLVYGVH